MDETSHYLYNYQLLFQILNLRIPFESGYYNLKCYVCLKYLE